MSISSFALKTAALLALAMPYCLVAQPTEANPTARSTDAAIEARAATGISTSVVLTIATSGVISYGEDVAGYALVSSSDGSTLTGTVTFYDGSANICTIPVPQTTSCPAGAATGFAVGTHLLTAVYSGDAAHLGSTSNGVPITVLPDATTLTLTTSVNPSIYGQGVVLMAKAQAAHAVPSGPITFLDGSTVLGAATLNTSGVATVSTASLGTGSHTITATYAGDGNTAAISSAALAEVVNTPSVASLNPFTVTVTGIPTVETGRAVNLLVTVAPQTGSIQPVQLSCAALPPESACTFATATLPVNGGTTSLQISTMAPNECGSASPYFQSAEIPFSGPVIAGLALLFLPRRKRRSLKGLLIALAAVCGLATLSGCGNCTDLGTRPGDYTIQVIGTSTGAAANAVIAKIVLHVTVP
ncbi:MAG: Ig-like domain-containing protein [Edaphobacter sp.]